MPVVLASQSFVEIDPAAPAATFVVPKPAGLAVGDLMIAEIYTNGAQPVLLAGWADVANVNTATNPKAYAMWKIADATDVAAASFTFTTGTTSGDAIIKRYTGHSPTTPIDFTAVSFATNNASQQLFEAGSTRTVTKGSYLIGGAAANTGPGVGTFTPPVGWVTDYQPTVGKACQSAHYGPAAAGCVTDGMTFTLNVQRAGLAWIAGIRPAVPAIASWRTGSLRAELNRIAGTYNLGETAAANAWAGTTGLALLGALNAKAGTSGKGLAAVCNQLAGTTNLAAIGALEQIQ